MDQVLLDLADEGLDLIDGSVDFSILVKNGYKLRLFDIIRTALEDV